MSDKPILRPGCVYRLPGSDVPLVCRKLHNRLFLADINKSTTDKIDLWTTGRGFAGHWFGYLVDGWGRLLQVSFEFDERGLDESESADQLEALRMFIENKSRPAGKRKYIKSKPARDEYGNKVLSRETSPLRDSRYTVDDLILVRKLETIVVD